MISAPQYMVSTMTEQQLFNCSLNLFTENCEEVMVSDKCLLLDETLYPTRVSVTFRQQNKTKHAKYGLLFPSVNSAEMPYTYTSTLYSGKPSAEGNEYYSTTLDDLAKYLPKV